jgi:CRISPR-associated protein Cmr1
MKTLRYHLSLQTPAFLGNASQQAQWRTPPIKALLRQWWRVAYAAEKQFDVDVAAMRREEALLFGHAWLEGDVVEHNGKIEKAAARKSEVRIRLENTHPGANIPHGWTAGTQQGVKPLSTGQDTSYAWFGLINRPGLPDRSAIKTDTGTENVRLLRLATPESHVAKLQEVMALIGAFGLLGSRSRGGWGALHVPEADVMAADQFQHYARPLEDCLENDWPMSLASHHGQLAIWHSQEVFKSWDRAMRFIAAERKHVRTSLKGLNGKDLRPALGFASPGRMPSPLRWKVIPSREGNGLKVRIFAMPHCIPAEGGQRISDPDLRTAWLTVFETLQAAQSLTRLSA